MGLLQKDVLGVVVEVKLLYYTAALSIITFITALVTVKMEVSDVQVIKLLTTD